MKFPIFCGVGAAVVFLAMAGCNRSGASGGAVAMVGKDPITEKAFLDYLQRKPTVTAAPTNQRQTFQVSPSLGFQALKDLIINQIYLQLAKDQNVYPSDKDVNEELDSQRQQQPTIIDSALAQGISVDDLKNEFRLELAKFNLQTKGVKVTKDDAAKYIKDHQDPSYIKLHPKEGKIVDPARVQAQMVIISPSETVRTRQAALADITKKKADVEHALASGQPFETIAKEYTTNRQLLSAFEKNGFHYPKTQETEMPPALWALLDKKTDELKTTDWQPFDKSGLVFVKFYIEKKIAEKPTAITPALVERVRRFLAQKQGIEVAHIDLAKLVASRIQTLNSKDEIKINIKQDQPLWKDMVTKLDSELAQSNAAGSLGATPPPGAGAVPGPASAPTGAPAPSAPATGKK